MTIPNGRPNSASGAGQGGECLLRRGFVTLLVMFVVTCIVYGAISLLSHEFRWEVAPAERPTVTVIAMFGLAFLVYLAAIRVAACTTQDARLVWFIFGSAVVYRLLLLPSTPIQEIDIYRYLWDGAVAVEGVSPFKYSPQQVVDAEDDQGELGRLVRLRQRDPAVEIILGRVHFRHLPTVYPPVSQVVFAIAAKCVSSDASVETRVIVMKAWLVLFDLATLLLVFRLLCLAGRPVGLSVMYAWCPLLMKEVANSGHLDAIAVFLVTLAIYFLVQAARAGRGERGSGEPTWPMRSLILATLSAVALSLAIGAKLYPVVLAPLMTMVVVWLIGWKRALIPIAAAVATTCFCLQPMLGPRVGREQPRQETAEYLQQETGQPLLTSRDRTRGLEMFLRGWEMNDFLFLLVIENVKPDDAVPANEHAWFCLIPRSVRARLNEAVRDTVNGMGVFETELNAWETAFLLSRIITLAAFLLVASWLILRCRRVGSVAVWLESAFLTLAWFWLLCPTLNPWYWTWVLPLLPFARGRTWWLMSGCVMLYYLRFYFRDSCAGVSVYGTGYHGAVFFDLVGTWFEFAPWFVLLALGGVVARWEKIRFGAGQGGENTDIASGLE